MRIIPGQEYDVTVKVDLPTFRGTVSLNRMMRGNSNRVWSNRDGSETFTQGISVTILTWRMSDATA